MAKKITIKLTDKQRQQIQKATGQDHKEVKIEAFGAADALSGKSAPRIMRQKVSPRDFGGMQKKLSPRSPISATRKPVAATRKTAIAPRAALKSMRKITPNK